MTAQAASLALLTKKGNNIVYHHSFIKLHYHLFFLAMEHTVHSCLVLSAFDDAFLYLTCFLTDVISRNWRSHKLWYWSKPEHRVTLIQERNTMKLINIPFLGLVCELPSKDSLCTIFVFVCQSERELQRLVVCRVGGDYSAMCSVGHYISTNDWLIYALCLSFQHALRRMYVF